MCIISRHEQVCLMRPFREIPLPSIGLIKHLHDVINLLYYEHWTDKWKYTPYISETRKVLKSCRSKMATWTHDVCDVTELLHYVWKPVGKVLFVQYIYMSPPHQAKICSSLPDLEKFPSSNFYSLLTKSQFLLLPPNKKLQPNRNVIFSDSHCSCNIFVLISSYSFDTHFMQTWILIDVQYSQNAIFSFEKSSNRQNQNYSSSGSHQAVKKFLPAVLTAFWHKVRETL